MAMHKSWEEMKAGFLEAKTPEDRLRYEGYERGCRETWEEMQAYYDELRAAGDAIADALIQAQVGASWLCTDENMAALRKWRDPHRD
jgi:hypothetical protein